MNATSAVSVAFDPLLSWEILAVLGGIGLVGIVLSIRARARGTLAAPRSRQPARR